MLFRATVTVFALACCDIVVASATSYQVRDSFNVPRGWKQVGEPPADHTIELHIGLTQSRFDELERHLYEVSDPEHVRYGQHLSQGEVHDLVRPSDVALESTHQWLEEHGIDRQVLSYSAAKDWLRVLLPVSKVEQLLQTKYAIFEHEASGHQLVRAPEWSLPSHLHEHIDAVQPTNSFFRNMPKSIALKPVAALGQSGAAVPAAQGADLTIANACNFSAVTPTCLRTLYGTYSYTVQSNKSRVGLNDFLMETNNRSDTHLFLSRYRPEAAEAAYTFKFDVVNGGSTNQKQETPAELAAGRELEGNLDSETILGIAYPIPLTAYTTGGSPPFMADKFATTDSNEPYLRWVNHILSESDSVIPQTISTSYADDEQTVPPAYAQKVCKQFAQLGARGVSLFFGSGDEGVGANGTCFSNDGKNRHEFIASFPSSCPYITSVGGTKDYPPVAAFDPRNGFASGGGFSNYFARPSYQDAAVASFFSTLGNKYSGLYNKSGRGYPDLSAQSQSFITAWNGSFVLLDGTSASTPTTASVFALLNDALMAAGKAPLGFLNPWLYSKGYKGFTDVTNGSALGCSGAGFPAVKGWDAVTGFGTPQFKTLRNILGV